jgi:hypothetical protein
MLAIRALLRFQVVSGIRFSMPQGQEQPKFVSGSTLMKWLQTGQPSFKTLRQAHTQPELWLIQL